MRLLNLQADGTVSLVNFAGREHPQYAILSHTWGPDNDEVTFEDVEQGTGKGKAGYRKLVFCGKQALKDGLGYFWVDTCCIDKKSSSELQEAITSMFRWYTSAARCYVYMSDVSTSGPGVINQSFEESRWFTRGWTLQELLAPISVEFFCVEGNRLGDKSSLQQEIAKITRIPVEALQGRALSSFSVGTRMKWAEGRQTKREEDAAYALLGIFTIHMPLLYGEGKENALKRLERKIQNSRSRNRNHEERFDKLRKWLSAPDPVTNYHQGCDLRQPGTGVWLLESPRFAEWKVNASSQLWLYGIAGCGKTVLSSTVVDHLLKYCHNAPGMATAYFYFDFKDARKQVPDMMLRSLLDQLMQRLDTIPSSLDASFSSYENELREPLQHELLQMTRGVVQHFTHVYIVLDALDECTQRSRLMHVLRKIAGWQLQNLHLLTTSRNVESFVEAFLEEKHTLCIRSEIVDEDIQRYVRQTLTEDKSLVKWNKDDLRQEIETNLIRGARGMFQWAACQLDNLRRCRNRAMLRKSLKRLPLTLEQTYDRILSTISEQDSAYAIRILQWLTFSARPLSLQEVAEVAAIDLTNDPAFNHEEVLEDPEEALIICSSLVTRIPNDGKSSRSQDIIALAHYTVREYLLSDSIKQGPAKRYSMHDTEGHSAITVGCLQYLLELQNWKTLPDEAHTNCALARYTAEFWNSHLHKTGNRIGEMSSKAVELFSTETPAYLTWVRLFDPDNPWAEPDFQKTLEETPGPLYYAANLGLTKVVDLLLEKGQNVNREGGDHGHALQAAAAGGHELVVMLLLEKGAQVNAQGGHYGTALQAASYIGSGQITELLLMKGADINAQGGCYANALQAASARGHERVVRMLLEKGAEVNAQGGHYRNALQAASAAGHELVVRILLEKSAEVNAQGGHYRNALQAASAGGHEAVVKMLLGKGAEVHAQGGHYGTALQAASYKGSMQITELLLTKNADVNAQGGYYGTALQAASAAGHEQVVRMLLEKGAEVNAHGGHYGTALLAASARGHELVVRMLLDKGAEANAQGGHYGSILQAASTGGHELVVRMLLDKGAEVNAQGGHYGSVLQAASAAGHEQVVGMLLKKGAEVNAQGGYYGTALQTASAGGHELVVGMLLEKGAEVNAQGGHYGTALQAASFKGSEQITELLLTEGAEVNAQGGYYANALQAASAGGHEQVVRMLLEKGAEVNAHGGHYGTTLQAASYKGSRKIIELLLTKGADIDAQGGHYGNALQAASARGHEQVVALLVNKNADINAQGGRYEYALRAAATRGHDGMVRLLLEMGAEVNRIDTHYGSFLNFLAYKGFTRLLKLAYKKYGASVNFAEPYGRTPLHLAARGGHIDCFLFLMDQGLDPLVPDAKGDSLLCYACSGGSLQLLDAVLQIDSILSIHCGRWSPLHWACRAGVYDIVERLIDKDLRFDDDTTSEPEDAWSPVSIALFHGNENMLRRLFTNYPLLRLNGTGSLQRHSTRHGGYWCNGCFHDIYGPRFRCCTCPNLDYCIMCKPYLDDFHDSHRWECVEFTDESR